MTTTAPLLSDPTATVTPSLDPSLSPPSSPTPDSLSPQIPNPQSEICNSSEICNPSIPLPPSERDFQIYDAIHISGCSTRSQADLHQISQTRVRQVVRRVAEWMGQVLPPQTQVAKEQQTHLARQIAADRFQHQYEQATRFWDVTQESKYAGLRMRLTTAQARLGVVGASSTASPPTPSRASPSPPGLHPPSLN